MGEKGNKHLNVSLIIYATILSIFFIPNHLSKYTNEYDEGNHENRQFKPSASSLVMEPRIDKQWCPNSKCANSHLCYPCNRRFLLILATPNSDSTLLTHMLHSLPNLRMAGDSFQTLQHLHSTLQPHYQQQLQQQQNENTNLDPPHSNSTTLFPPNPIPPGALACVAQTLIETVNPPLLTPNFRRILAAKHNANGGGDDTETIVGFQSLHFLLPNNGNNNDDNAWVDFLTAMFPCLRVVWNIRSGDGGLKRQAATATNDNNNNDDGDAVRRMRQMHHLLGDQRSFFLDSAVWTNTNQSRHLSSLNELVQWLGYSQGCVFPKLVHPPKQQQRRQQEDARSNQNSSSSKVEDDESVIQFESNCYYPWKREKRRFEK